MKLTFLGTRGAHVPAGNGHCKHSALLIEQDGHQLLIDCGSDWPGLLSALRPDAVLISHAHDDHVGGLGAAPPCPLWASSATWEALADLDHPARQTFMPKEPLQLAGCEVLPWPLKHSLRAPTVAFRIRADTSTLFYAPDVADLPDSEHALHDVDIYIGDGAAFDEKLLRVENGEPCGHAPLPLQLSWCQQSSVPRMIITHCGAALVSAGYRQALDSLQRYAQQHAICLETAYDGLQINLP